MAQVQVQPAGATSTLLEMMKKKPQASSCCSDDMADLERALEAAAPTTVPRQDSLYRDATRAAGGGNHDGQQDGWARTLRLAFQCVGVLYGDIGTSPLYVYSSTFPGGIRHPDDLLGVLSLILYTLILIPMLKYVFVVLHANDDGDGELIITWLCLALLASINNLAQHGFMHE